MLIYNQFVNVRRMSCVRWHATWRVHLASHVGTVYCFHVDRPICTAFLFVSRHLQYLLVL